jgi:hypothetical protein
MKVYLPAWSYTSFYLVTGKESRSDECCRFQLAGKIETIQTLVGGKQRGGAHTHSPVKHREEILAFDINYLARRLCELLGRDGRNNIYGYGVIKGAKSSSDSWDTYGIFFLFRYGQIEGSQKEKDQKYYVAITKVAPSSGEGSGQQPSFKWLLLVGGSELNGCDCIELEVSLQEAGKSKRYYKLRHISKKVEVVPLDRLVTYPRLYIDEVAYIPIENRNNLVEAGSAVAEVIYSGSQIFAKSRKGHTFLPVLIHYDVKGEDPPRHIFPSARRYSLRLSLTVDEVYKIVKETMLKSCSWNAVLKVLVQNTVAKSLGGLCRSYRGWIFEREISTNIFNKTIVFTTPILWRIEMFYNNIYVQRGKVYECNVNGLKSILARWRNTIFQLRHIDENECPHAKDDSWFNHFAECLADGNTYTDFKTCIENKATRSNSYIRDVIFGFFETYATWALLLGAHGLSHILLKTVARDRHKTGYAEKIELYLPSHFSRVLRVLPVQPGSSGAGAELDGVFRIEAHGGKDIGLEVKIFDLRGLSSLSTDELLRILEEQASFSNRCDKAFEEERNRLERAFNILKDGCQGLTDSDCQGLIQFDSFMKELPKEAAPPRFIFRFLLPQIEKKELQGYRLPKKFYQYIWPRYVHSCADGCHLCVLAPGRLCAYPPSQMEFKTSKTYAMYLVNKLLEELKHSG